MKRLCLFTFIAASLITGCKTAPVSQSIETSAEVSPAPVPQPEEPPQPIEDPVSVPEKIAVQTDNEAEEDEFDPSTITQEEFDITKVEVQVLIANLSRIIRSRNYYAWIDNLGDQYLTHINSSDFLKQMSNHPRLKSQKIILTSSEDYFMHVVVPSRSNEQVDDIEFIGHRRVKAFMDISKGERLRLYDLERTEQGWKIIN